MATVTDEPLVQPRAASRPRQQRSLGRLINGRYVTLVIAGLAVAYLALVPIGTMLYASFQSNFLGIGSSTWTLHNFVSTFTADNVGELILNSFVYAGVTAMVSVVIGFGLAWLVVRTNTPCKAFARLAALVPLIIPGILNTVAWSLMLSPQRGPINVWLRSIHLPTFNVFSLTGMIFVQSIHVVPIAFLMGTASFTSMDSSLEEASLASGASPIKTFRRITLRMARPAILSAALLMFIQTISTFEVPQIIGVRGHRYVFVTQIYSALQSFPADYGTVSVLGMFVLVVAAIGLAISRRVGRSSTVQTITGKGFRPHAQDIGKWRWLGLFAFVLFFVIAVALPLLELIWAALHKAYVQPSVKAFGNLSFHNFHEILVRPGLVKSVENSLIIALCAGLIVTVLASLIAYITVKTKVRGRGMLDGLATVPIAVPSVILGVGVLFFYLVAPLPFHLYGTLTILVIAFVTITLPYAMRYIAPGMAQIKDELEEAATASGASWLQTFRRVFIPLLMPSLLAAFLYAMIVSFREVSAAIFLYGPHTEPVAVQIYDLYANGSYPVVAALGIVMVLFLVVLAALVGLVTRRFGIKRQ
jgi:iron(III) transport system permease protein